MVDLGYPRQPKALEEEEEEFDPYKRVKVGCCWYAAIQIEDNQKSRQPKSLGFENQNASGGGQLLRGGRNLGGNRKRRPRRPRRRRKSKLPLDRVISSAEPEDECFLYKLADFKKSGQLVDAFNNSGSKVCHSSQTNQHIGHRVCQKIH